MASPISVNATSTLVQQASGGCNGCSISNPTASFTNPVASGDVIVVAEAGWAAATAPTVSDTLGLSFTRADFVCNQTTDFNCAAIYYATAASSGADTITVTYGSNPITSDIFIYELSGVTTTGAVSSTGYGQGSPISISSATFTNLGFAVSVVNTNGYVSYTPGAGFTASAPSSGSQHGYAEYALSGITTPTTFPATIGSPIYWAEAGLVLGTSGPAASSIPLCPSTSGGALMPTAATFTDSVGNVWVAPSGSSPAGSASSYFFQGPMSNVPPPMWNGWGGSYGTYDGQQGWIITFYCA